MDPIIGKKYGFSQKPEWEKYLTDDIPTPYIRLSKLNVNSIVNGDAQEEVWLKNVAIIATGGTIL